MSERVCNTCGEDAPPGTEFCPTCGAYLGWGGHAASAPGGDPAGATRSGPVTARTAPTGGTAPVVPLRPIVSGGRADPTSEVRRTPTTTSTRSVPPNTTGPQGTGRQPVAVQPVSEAVPAGLRCPVCATINDETRRFCSRCGTFVGTASAVPAAASAAPVPWWRRWLRRRTPAERRARAAYRKSLPLGIRLRRWLIAAAVLVLAFAYLMVIGRDPVGWVKQRLYALRGTVAAVPNVSASSQPASADPQGAKAAAAVDGNPGTAWSARFDPSTITGAPCERGSQETALVLTAKREFTLRAVRVQAGLADPQRRLENWRPTMLDLRLSDGSCRTVTLRDDAAPQQVDISPVHTRTVTITVVKADPPAGGFSSTQTHLTEVQLLQRPPS